VPTLASTATGHRRGLLAAADRPEAELVLSRATGAGVGFPVVVRFTVPQRPAGRAPAATAAADQAGTACARALDAAVRSAVAATAVQAVAAEVAVTRARLRAVQDRWLPRLVDRTRVVLAELDEQERAEGVRLRWAARRRR
jgi:V/A-type H+-transporting ATPase subunit D